MTTTAVKVAAVTIEICFFIAGRLATCGSAGCHTLTSPFRALVHPQGLYIHPPANFAEVHGGMLFESYCDAVFDVFPSRWTSYLFAVCLRLASPSDFLSSN